MSVLTYAVEELKIDHIVVAGHTFCGGATHCYNSASKGPTSPAAANATPLSRWLNPLTDLAREQQQLSVADVDVEDREKAIRALIEKNVVIQVRNVAKTSIVKEAWKKGRDVHVHGWVYELETGRLRDLEVSVSKSNAKENGKLN